jgi:hypothetical protein
VETEGLKILFAVEPRWTVALNGLQFLALNSSEISVNENGIQFGGYFRKIGTIEWLRPNVVRICGQARMRNRTDTITFYPGAQLPRAAEIQRKRRAFQTEIGRALCSYFGVRKIERETLHTDRQHGIGGAYPRFIVGDHAVITVDADEAGCVINGIMRAALVWAPLVRRPVTAIVPHARHHTIAARLRRMQHVRRAIRWLQWDGNRLEPLDDAAADPETCIQPFALPEAAAEVERICSVAPDLLQAVPYLAGKAISIRLRGIEVARVSEQGTTYPLGEPLADVVRQVEAARRPESGHPLARAHEERWLESNLLADIGRLLPSIDTRYIYPQVPSFVGEERNIIDLLTATLDGRLVVIEIKAAPDPDLPFQALDYWIAVERHRQAGDFERNGYFPGCRLQNEPALLVLVAPLLSFHKTAGEMIAMLPPEVPLMELGINQRWKERIKVLRRKGRSVRLKDGEIV